MAEQTDVDDLRRTLRERRLRTVLIAAAVTALIAISTASTWQSVAVVAPSLVLAALLLLRMDEPLSRPLLLVTMLIGVATLIWAALSGASAVASTAPAVTAGILVERSSRHRGLAAGLALLPLVAISALTLTTGSENAVGRMLQLSFVAAIWLLAVLDLGSEIRLFSRLEQAKDAESELSLARERHRFAADLHDIQGQTLHVIRLKASVAAELQATQPHRTTEELAAIRELSAEAIARIRERAESRRELRLEDELRNAIALLEADGTEVTVDHGARPAPRHDAVLAHVVREATTNVLRHAAANRVRIRLDAHEVEVRNDGIIRAGGPPVLRGLRTLRERVESVGGTLEIRPEAGEFALLVRIDPEERA